MRYSIHSKNHALDYVESCVNASGGRVTSIARRVGIVFAELTPDKAASLKQKGFSVSEVKKTGPSIIPPVVTPPTPIEAIPIYTPEQIAYSIRIDALSNITSPPLTGLGVNVAIVDTGIYDNHEKVGNVVLAKNFTSSPQGDGFDHGTGVASVVLAVAPDVNLLDIKVIDDNGEGTEEETVLGLDYLLDLVDNEDDNAPDIVNMSIGAIDDGDPDSIIRVAVQQLSDEGIWVIVAAGNGGPEEGTVLTPASDPKAIAVGSCSYPSLSVSDFSSRGPTLEGNTKPDCLMFGENILVASSASDTATEPKTGTSFSSPFVAGIFSLVNEAMARNENLLFELDDIPDACGKPEGVEELKDNAYGWGLLLPELTAKTMTGVPTGFDYSQMLGLMMTVGMMGIVIRFIE